MGRAIAILLLSILVACAPAPPRAAPTVTAVAGGSTLRIFNWDTYIDPALIAEFEAATGARVVYSTYANSEELLGAVQADPTAYDLVVPSDYMVEVMRRERLLAPLDKANIPNLVNLDPLFASPAYDPGNRHCVPYLWGTVGLGYSSGAVDHPIIGWADIFERRSGTVAILDDPRVMLGAALLVLGHSPNTTDPRIIAAARDFLLERAGNFDAVAPDTGQDLLAAGTVDLAVEWSGDIFQVNAEHGDLQYVIPAEGSIIWTDNMCILAGSPNHALAEQFINFILAPRPGAALANYTRFSTPNRAALPWVRPEDLANPALYPDQRTRERLFFLVDVGPEAADLYTRSWAEVLAAVP